MKKTNKKINERTDNDREGLREGWMNYRLDLSIENLKQHIEEGWRSADCEFGPGAQIDGPDRSQIAQCSQRHSWHQA